MARHRLPHHRAYECFHRRMSCDGCGVSVTFRESKDSHPCSASPETTKASNSDCCPSCGQECAHTSQSTSLTSVTTNTHVHRWVCPKALVPCAQNARGCPAIVARDELESHSKTCAFEALSSFFAANDARFAALERKQEELRSENEGLRAQLWSLRRAEIVPRSLRDGPEPTPTHQPPPPASPQPPPVSPTTPTSSAVADARPAPAPELPTAPSLSATRSGLPPPLTLPPRPAPTPIQPAQAQRTPPEPLSPREQLVHIPPSFLAPPPRLSYTDWVLSRLPPPTAYGDGCAALRAALIHLAAGLDASERRNEV